MSAPIKIQYKESIVKPPPKDWGNDEITKYFDILRNNQYAAFNKLKAPINECIMFDGLFRKFLDGAINPRPSFPMLFYLSSHAAYLNACQLAMSGQLGEISTIHRLCLENAAYGAYIGSNESRAKVWLDRHKNEKTKRKVRTEFTHRKIADHLKKLSPKLGNNYEKLYERNINYGAHPNERGMTDNIQIVESNNKTITTRVYATDDTDRTFKYLQRTAEVAIWSLRAAEKVYPEKFQLLRITEQLNRYVW